VIAAWAELEDARARIKADAVGTDLSVLNIDSSERCDGWTNCS
jgi:hypothetical protein